MHPTYILSALALALPVYSSSSTASMGCYSDVGDLRSQGPYIYQSPGYCQNNCSKKGFKVAALSRGTMCYCGDKLPSQSAKIDDDKCDQACSGWPAAKCGGNDTYTLIQATEAVDASDSDADSDSDNASTTVAPTAATAAGGIIVAPSTASTPTGIITAASSINSKSANTASSKAAGSATAAVTSTATPTPTGNAAGTIRAGSSLIGVVVAGMGLLL